MAREGRKEDSRAQVLRRSFWTSRQLDMFVVQIDTMVGRQPWEDNSDPQPLSKALIEAAETRAAGWGVRVLPA